MAHVSKLISLSTSQYISSPRCLRISQRDTCCVFQRPAGKISTRSQSRWAYIAVRLGCACMLVVDVFGLSPCGDTGRFHLLLEVFLSVFCNVFVVRSASNRI